jgi:hypothetical protein
MSDSDKTEFNFEPEFVILVASGLSIRAAARQLGIPEATAYRMSQEPEFRKLVSDARHTMLSEGVGAMTAGIKSSITKLLALTADKDKKISLSAIRTHLSEMTRFTELLELSERVQALEESMSQTQGQERWGL